MKSVFLHVKAQFEVNREENRNEEDKNTLDL